MDIIAIAELAATLLLAAFVVFLPIELWRLWRAGRLDRAYVKEMAASASPLLPALAVNGIVLAWAGALFGLAERLTPLGIPTNAWSFAACLLLVDFLYYIDHRCGHRVRAYWAISHSVHHSSPQYDQTTGLRVSFVDGFLTIWFYLPAVLLGFEPLLVAACFGIIIAYQQWLHTETIGRLGWFDGIFNSPANHRVHHGTQPDYLDRNYGAVLMIWDQLFGTYQAERAPPVYGLVEPIASVNPLTVHIAEARNLWRDLRAARGWRQRLLLLLLPPGTPAVAP